MLYFVQNKDRCSLPMLHQNLFDTQFPIFKNLPAETNGFFEQT